MKSSMKHWLLGGIALLGTFGALAAQTLPDLDLSHIARQAEAVDGATQAFVRQLLERIPNDFGPAKEVAEQAQAHQVIAPKALLAAGLGEDLAEAMQAPGLPGAGEEDGATGSAKDCPALLAFASTSMPPEALERMIADVSKAGGTVVFRGFALGEVGVSGGTRGFLELLRKAVPEGSQARVIIDPRLFRSFGIEEVPTYVAASSSFPLCDGLDCTSIPTPHDRIAGNVTTRYALETFVAGKGPGAQGAARALQLLAGEQ